MQNGDLILVAGSHGGSSSDDGLSTGGYTSIGGTGGGSTFQAGVGLYYREYDGTGTTVSTNGCGDTSHTHGIVVMVFRGVKTVANGGPFDTTRTLASTNDGSPNPASIDHSNASGIWIVVGAVGAHTTGSASFTFPTGYTTNAAQVNANDLIDIVTGICYRSSGISDPEDPGVITNSGGTSSRGSGAVTMALSPAGAPTTERSASVNADAAIASRGSQWFVVNVQAVAFDGDRIDLTWDEVVADGFVFYQVLRDGTVVGEPTDNAFSDTGLEPDTEYDYTVRAVEEG